MKDREFTVILEDLKSQFRVFGEGLEGLDNKVDDIIEMTGKNTENIEIMKSDIAFIKTELRKFVRVEEFETLERRVALLEKKLARVG